MRTIDVDELCNLIPRLRETLQTEHERVLVMDGEPVARILPIVAAPELRSLAHFRVSLGRTLPDSTPEIRIDRDRRGT